MDAVDTWIPLPPRDVDKQFLMPVEDVFSITGRGTVAVSYTHLDVYKRQPSCTLRKCPTPWPVP